MNKQPYISVALTTYNGQKYLKKQLDSILNQTKKVDEIIVCDDCSSDNTNLILQQYPVNIIQNTKRLGFINNFKKALENCNGKYIFLCDQDDIWENSKVEEMINIVESHHFIQVLASSFKYIDQNDDYITVKPMRNHSNNNLYPKPVKDKDIVEIKFSDLIYANFFQGCSLLLNNDIKNFYLQHFDDSIPHDWLINLYASSMNSLYFYNSPLFKYRIHNNNTLGIPDVAESVENHAKRANTIDIRLQQPKAILQAITIMKKTIPNYYAEREMELDELSSFLINHIDYIENKKLVNLILQNRFPQYKKMKYWRGRLMDIIYLLTN